MPGIQWQFQIERCWCGHLLAAHVHSLGVTHRAQCVDCTTSGVALRHAFHDFAVNRPKAIVLYANYMGYQDREPGWQDRFIAERGQWETDDYWISVLDGNEPELRSDLPAEGAPRTLIAENHPARTPYEFPDNLLVDRPPRDNVATGNQPGDESKVFIVMHGMYSDQTIDAVFVGNRGAAERYVAEYSRYHSYDEPRIEEFEDGATGGGGGLMRVYPDPYTLITVTTHVHYHTGAILYNYGQTSLCDDEPNRTKIDNAISSSRVGRQPVITIRTQGPDSQMPKLRKIHQDEVARVRAIIIDDPDLLDPVIDGSADESTILARTTTEIATNPAAARLA